MPEARLLEVTEAIYGAAAGDTPWSTVANGIKRIVSAQSAWLVAQRPEATFDVLYSADFPPDAVADYQAHYRALDLWVNRRALAVAASPQAPLKAFISGYLVTDAEYTRTEFYSDFGRRNGLRHVMGTVIPLGATGVMPVGLHRPDTASPFEWADARLLDYLLPHLRRAMQLRHHLAAGPASRPTSIAVLDAISAAILVADSDMGLVLANAAAEHIISTNECLRVVAPRSLPNQRVQITALNHADNAALRALVTATAHGDAGGALRLRDSSHVGQLAVLVAPLPRRLVGEAQFGRVAGQALLLLRDLSMAPARPSATVLRDLFDLTAAEAEVACGLVGGASKVAVASARGLQPSTVKTQVKAIFDKTGVTNLRDLERLLASLSP